MWKTKHIALFSNVKSRIASASTSNVIRSLTTKANDGTNHRPDDGATESPRISKRKAAMQRLGNLAVIGFFKCMLKHIDFARSDAKQLLERAVRTLNYKIQDNDPRVPSGAVYGFVLRRLGSTAMENPTARETIISVLHENNKSNVLQWIQRSKSSLAHCRPVELQAILSGLSKLDLDPMVIDIDWTAELFQSFMQQLPRVQPRELCSFMYSAMELNIDIDSLIPNGRSQLLHACNQLLLQQEAEVDMYFLTNILMSLNWMQVEPSDGWYNDYFARLQQVMVDNHNLKSFISLPALFLTTRVPARVIPRLWLSKYLRQSLPLIESYSKRDIIQLLVSFARLGSPPIILNASYYLDFITLLLEVNIEHLQQRSCNIYDLINLAQALENLKYPHSMIPKAWSTQLVACAQQQIRSSGDINPKAIADLAFAISRIAPAQTQLYYRALSNYKRPMHDSYFVTHMVRALGQMEGGAQGISRTLLRELTASSADLLRLPVKKRTADTLMLSPASLCNILHVYAKNDINPDHYTAGWLEAFLEYSSPLLNDQAFSVSEIGFLAQSLMQLNTSICELSTFDSWFMAYMNSFRYCQQQSDTPLPGLVLHQVVALLARTSLFKRSQACRGGTDNNDQLTEVINESWRELLVQISRSLSSGRCNMFDIGVVMYWLGAVRLHPDSFCNSFMETVFSESKALISNKSVEPLINVANIAMACGILNIELPADWLDVVFNKTQRLLTIKSNQVHLLPHECSVLLYGLASCNVTPPKQWLRAFMDHLLPQLTQDVDVKVIERTLVAHDYLVLKGADSSISQEYYCHITSRLRTSLKRVELSKSAQFLSNELGIPHEFREVYIEVLHNYVDCCIPLTENSSSSSSSSSSNDKDYTNKAGSRKLVILIDSEDNVLGDGQPIGKVRLENALLEEHGYRVIRLPWNELNPQNLVIVKELLRLYAAY